MGRVELETTSRRIERLHLSIRRELGWIKPYEGWSKAQDDFLYELVAEYEHARISVTAKSSDIRLQLDSLDKKIEADLPFLNSLGELQGRPAALEAAVGQFCAYRRLIDAFVKRHKVARDLENG
jgi:hypothetical protein